MIEKEIVKWEEMEEFVESLITHLNEKNIKPVGVYGIPRGGLVFATLLSYKMDIPLLLAPSENCIIVDDIADSGRTLMHFTENDTQFNKYFIATMYYHERSLVKPDFYLYNKNDKWIVFPWEVND